ncbi:RNA polymerase sigma factor [Clostridium algidicarnis]|uniref:RNA polymerase sigma factor n=3 Tax=Clostridium algidicarnis TaxID=37659 RepID=UPI0016293623|nr:RNA polymerase sigma factor [Clostridium algidicarnis]MBB6698697.1 RNA polymerase sigma factor [Clostridium algidicarnis]MBU3203437.1 RNA polymerase sigma factor [Clostridium algidicarnis]MBU3211591.1 RNA polymerase sigma factor [Clostridium algidicarnis]MBU3221901.1 RNA polymerase sigma factor [Clostridium algidicarnis]
MLDHELKLIKNIQKKGHRESANILIKGYYSEIYGYVFKQTSCRQLAADITQEIFISMIRSIDNYNVERCSFRTWIYKIASNKIIDYYRSKNYKQWTSSMTIDCIELKAKGDIEDKAAFYKGKYNKDEEQIIKVTGEIEDYYMAIPNLEFNSNLKGEVKKLDELSNNISFKEIEESLSKIRSMGYFIDNFENKDNNSYIESGAQKDRLTEINKTKVNNDILPWFIFDNYNSFIINTTLLVIVSIIFILGPIFTKDEVVNMEVLQYTTRRGRRLYKDKIAAVLISAFIMVTLELSILFTLFLTRQNTVELFYNSNINSCFKYGANWFDLTLIQYIILSIIIVYILAFALALIISYVSRKSHRYITFTGISLLIVIILSKIITSNTIMLGIGSIDIPRFLVFGFISAMVLIGVVSLEVRYKKEKLLDIF